MNTQQGLDEIERIAADETVVANVESEAEVKMAETIPVETPPAVVPSVDDSSLYIHRELSQLQFNIRVLEQALDESYPLLERLKFLLIFSSNLDEFFEIRIAGLKKQITFAREQAGADGLLPHQALARISWSTSRCRGSTGSSTRPCCRSWPSTRSASSAGVTGR